MSEPTQRVIEYIVSQIIRRPGIEIDEDTPLVSSGLIDSLALVDILQKLEDVTNTRVPAGKVQAKDMETVRLMFSTVARVGKRRDK